MKSETIIKRIAYLERRAVDIRQQPERSSEDWAELKEIRCAIQFARADLEKQICPAHP